MIYKGYDINIEQDEDAESPRKWDNLGTMYCEHGRYTLGDEDARPPRPEDGEIVSLPLYLYDHSGITMNTTGFSCGWDSGQVGIIYVTRERIKEEFKKGITDAEVVQYLKAEVMVYNHYLTGNVYGYDIEGVDSCWGYYGDDHEANGLLDEARGAIDYEIKREQEADRAAQIERWNKIKAWIINRVPYHYREAANE